ncbi:unnamed protein product [Camellia sinensis]
MGIVSIVFFIFLDMVVIAQTIPTTLQGPFTPVTHSLDPSLRLGSDDLPMDNPRLKRNVTAIFPEQIALALSSSSSMWVSWVTGDSQIGLNVTALDPSTVASEVWYGKESGDYSMKMTGVSTVYSQLYPYEGLWNYTSGIIHHVKIDGPSYCLNAYTGHPNHVISLDFHPKKNDLFCFCDSNNEIRYWNINPFTCARVSKQGGSAQVRFQPISGHVLAAASNKVVSIFDVETDRQTHAFQILLRE